MLKASCHCGAVELEVKGRPRQVTECNCSICRRYGVLWAYYSQKTVQLISDPEWLTRYTWKNGTLEFFHCKRCGCVTHYERARKRPTDTVAVNARMMEPQVVEGIRVRHFDGADTWQYLD